ncbi:MAG: glycosyltransferase family 39 protein [Deltaproteobacteria bacterium]
MTRLAESIKSLNESSYVLIVIALGVVVYASLSVVLPSPVNVMEVRNLVTAKECVVDGNCLSTTMNGLTRVRKPPLPSWVAAAMMSLSGETNSVYPPRIPSIFLTALFGVFVYFLSKLWLDGLRSFTSAVIVLTSYVILNEGWRAAWDIYTLTFAAGGLWLMCAALFKDKPPVAWLMASGVLWGLAFLSKWHFTVYAVLTPFLAALFFSKLKTGFKWKYLPVIGTVALATGLSWPVYMYFVNPESFSFVDETAAVSMREFGRTVYYYALFPFMAFPWTFLVFGTFASWFSGESRRILLSEDERERMSFFLLWFAFALVLLTIEPSKKLRYAMPLVMPAALFVSVFSGALERGGIASAPPLIRAFWKAHVFSISILALFIVVMSVLAVFLLDMPSYLPIAAAPLAYISYRVMRHKYSVIEVNLCAAVMVALVCFVLAVAGGSLFGGRIDEIRASGDMVSRLSAGYDKLYLFVNDTRAAWAVRRTAYEVEPVGIRIEKFPALILVEENSMHHLIPWAKERGISHKETYNFLYDPRGERALLLRLTKE